MRRHAPLFAGLTLILFVTIITVAREPAERGPRSAPPAATQDGITFYFSLQGGCTAAIVAKLAGAKKTIDVQAYSFTSTDIARAMSEAKDRGVKVRAILDKKASGEQYSGATYLANHGVETYTDGEHPIAHNKVMILEGSTVITGSFNFTRQAEISNAENLLIIEGKPKLAAAACGSRSCVMNRNDIICPNPNCGYVGPGVKKARGSGCVLVFLLLLWILPGILYLIFMSGYTINCPRCGIKIRDER
jgi:hypothetical protein